MRLSLSRESLLKPLERISGISVSSGGQKPILANVLLYVYPNPDPNGEIKDAPYILQMTCLSQSVSNYCTHSVQGSVLLKKLPGGILHHLNHMRL